MQKKLYRATDRRVLAGICSGLEDFTGIDATIWRLIFVLLTIAGAVPGPLIYLIMWLIIPRQDRKVVE